MVDDLEDATLVEVRGERFIVAVSSLEGDEGKQTEAGLVRVRIGAGGELRGELMPGSRTWLLSRYPELAPGGADVVDIQGLAWDADSSLLLVGVRSPTRDGAPLVLPVRMRDPGGPWQTALLEGLDPIALPVDGADRPKGILALARRPEGAGYVLLAGNPVGKEKRASLYAWDGAAPGVVRRLASAVFLPEVKPEGIAFGTIGGRAAAVLVDDTGGYYVVWQDDLGL
jgi:hypothetical protein